MVVNRDFKWAYHIAKAYSISEVLQVQFIYLSNVSTSAKEPHIFNVNVMVQIQPITLKDG